MIFEKNNGPLSIFDWLFEACLEECWMVFAIKRELKNEYFEKKLSLKQQILYKILF